MSVTIAFTALLTLFALLLQPAGSISHTWGQVNKYATRLYVKEIHLTAALSAVNITYPEQGDSSVYTISAIHVEDLGELLQTAPATVDSAAAHVGDSGALVPPATVLRGGIGYNYTTLRFVRRAVSGAAYQRSTADDTHFELVIYGVDL